MIYPTHQCLNHTSHTVVWAKISLHIDILLFVFTCTFATQITQYQHQTTSNSLLKLPNVLPK